MKIKNKAEIAKKIKDVIEGLESFDNVNIKCGNYNINGRNFKLRSKEFLRIEVSESTPPKSKKLTKKK